MKREWKGERTKSAEIDKHATLDSTNFIFFAPPFPFAAAAAEALNANYIETNRAGSQTGRISFSLFIVGEVVVYRCRRNFGEKPLFGEISLLLSSSALDRTRTDVH